LFLITFSLHRKNQVATLIIARYAYLRQRLKTHINPILYNKNRWNRSSAKTTVRREPLAYVINYRSSDNLLGNLTNRKVK